MLTGSPTGHASTASSSPPHDNPADVPVRCRHGWVLLDAEGNMVRYDPPVTLPPDIAESLNYLAF